ncbi:hypothetical protein VTO42DRAFT_838 [Malbranchea cinnamomea]
MQATTAWSWDKEGGGKHKKLSPRISPDPEVQTVRCGKNGEPRPPRTPEYDYDDLRLTSTFFRKSMKQGWAKLEVCQWLG